MHTARLMLLAGLMTALLVRPGRMPGDATSQAADEGTLKSAGIGSDGPALLEFFRGRTLTEEKQKAIEAMVHRLGNNAFIVRERASNELLACGRSAIAFLRPALKDPDLEVARRAQRCLDAIESGPEIALVLAAVHLTSLRSPEGAAQTLLNFLPFADQDTIEDALLQCLNSVGMREDKANDVLFAALKDALPLKRSAAAFVVGRSKEEAQRAAVKALLADADTLVRFRAAQGLIAGKDKEAIPTLVKLLQDAPTSTAWKAEEILCRIAGEKSPQVSLGSGEDAERRKCAAGWDAWWRDQGAKIDLAKINMEESSLGLTLVVVYDGYNNGQGRIWEYGADRKPRWSIDKDLQGPIDAQMISGNRVLIAEYNARRVTERDLTGKILWEYKVSGNPIACQRLSNGNTFIGTLNFVTEVTADRKEIYNHKVAQSQVTYAQKLRNGNILHLSSNGAFVEIDEKGKVIKNMKVGGNTGEWLSFELLSSGRYLVPQQNSGKLVEYDGAGKEVATINAPRPYSASRLPNGNTIACSMNDSKMYEVDHSGKVIWEERLQGRPFRVRRR